MIRNLRGGVVARGYAGVVVVAEPKQKEISCVKHNIKNNSRRKIFK